MPITTLLAQASVEVRADLFDIIQNAFARTDTLVRLGLVLLISVAVLITYAKAGALKGLTVGIAGVLVYLLVTNLLPVATEAQTTITELNTPAGT